MISRRRRLSRRLTDQLAPKCLWLLLLLPALALGDGALGDGTLGDGTLVDGAPVDGAPVDGAPGDGALPTNSVCAEAAESCEHFVIEWSGESPHPHQGYRGSQGLERAVRDKHLGLVEFHRRRVAGGWQLEQEVNFPFESVRLMAVECLSASSPRLVWREIGDQGGRTIFAEWAAQSEQLKVLEWGVDGSLRETIGTSQGAVMPQYLLELAREGKLVGGRFQVFDPLRGALDEWRLEVSYLRSESTTGVELEGEGYHRRVEFLREDGTSAGSYLFDGQRLISFQWQTGSIHARRISAEDYASLRDRMIGDAAESAQTEVESAGFSAHR